MGEFINLPDWKTTKSGEESTDRFLQWITTTKTKLLKAFPKGEQGFCRIFHKLKARLPGKWDGRLRYMRQKHFMVTPEIVFFGDFYFSNLRLLVEIDGDSHLGEQAKEKDRWRTELIGAWKVQVVRFTNDAVLSGDFRDIEEKFIIAAGKCMPFTLRRKLSLAYHKAKLLNPRIYTT